MLTDNSELDTVLAATIQAVVSASCRGRRQFLPDGLSRWAGLRKRTEL